ncbi:MAG: hypothetical protein B6I38_08285 [Anaerolineaceae bacterium 4572_5.1]|nr:MAG: hypothetical protein B5M51_04640 [Anaerolinea sp. 4484_236]OQY29414.1 MAG: hypothetical protein B6I38_08285 [Anaerolineaceae bacterium 4572_5.1]
MNEFLYHELLMEEYRRAKLAEAKQHRLISLVSEKKFTRGVYWILSRVGVTLESWGCKMQERYDEIVACEQSDLLQGLTNNVTNSPA